MSDNIFEDDDDVAVKPVDKIVFRPAPINAPELPTAKRAFDPAPRPRPRALDVPGSKEWIPGEKPSKNNKNKSKVKSDEKLLQVLSYFGKALSALVVLAVLSGIGYFVYWIVSQYKV